MTGSTTKTKLYISTGQVVEQKDMIDMSMYEELYVHVRGAARSERGAIDDGVEHLGLTFGESLRRFDALFGVDRIEEVVLCRGPMTQEQDHWYGSVTDITETEIEYGGVRFPIVANTDVPRCPRCELFFTFCKVNRLDVYNPLDYFKAQDLLRSR